LKTRWLTRRLALIALALFLWSMPAFATDTPGDDPPVDPPVEVNAVAASISTLSRTLAPGDAPFTISVLRYFPSASTMNEPLTWTTSNVNVAYIAIEETADLDPSVTVTPLKNGRATISLVGSRSGKTLAKCQVTVRTVKITSFAISPKSLTLAPTTSYQMAASVKPSYATYQSVTWTSSAPEIVSFSPLGEPSTTVGRGQPVTVYARAEGRAVLTALTNTNRKTTRVVTVKNLAVTSVKFPKTKYTIYLEAQTKTRLTASVSPSTAAEDVLKITYKCSDEVGNVLTLDTPDDGKGGVILSPHATGKVTLTATAGTKTAKTTIYIYSRVIKSLSVSTPDGMPVVLDSGEQAQLTAACSPSYAANRSVTWNSGNDAIATVDENGLVTAGSTPGAVRITCSSAANAKVTASVTVHVRGEGVYRTATVTAAGDAVLGGDPRKGGKAKNPRSYQLFREKVQEIGGEDQVFANVRSYFAGDNNVVTLNLEGTLTLKDTRSLTKSFVFQGHPNYAKTILKDSGVDAVNLANNHTYDVGKDGYEGTMRALNNKGMKYYGNGGICTIRTVNGVRVAFVGFVSQKIYMSTLKSNIQSASKKADIVVVQFHWTDVTEFRYKMPTSRQKSLSHSAINYGADLVIGTHTHRINGIERYKGKYIVYDLGNFVTIASNPLNQFGSSNPSGKYDYDSFIWQQDFNIWTDGFVEPSDIRIIPCSITSKPDELINNAQPTPYLKGGADYQRVMNHIRDYSIGDFSKYPINRDD
jgi:poly-gamma-glutamate synthesis protein (capsule biosynthesis protein)